MLSIREVERRVPGVRALILGLFGALITLGTAGPGRAAAGAAASALPAAQLSASHRAVSHGAGATSPAARRLATWRALLRDGRALSESAKLERVNRFFNRLRFVADAAAGGSADHWATPREVLLRDGGDCEDFALAKYFTLRALGVAAKRLRLTYVRSLGRNQAHMVLTYYRHDSASSGAGVLVLDNLEADILPLSRRSDLLPVYSFNSRGLWLAGRHGLGRRVGGVERLSRWQDLIRRMHREASPVAF
ncbi:MAG: transglutaminase-like cysteine peptidase [Gammaproteobacteria bacterium]